jgi:hypothetical protein
MNSRYLLMFAKKNLTFLQKMLKVCCFYKLLPKIEKTDEIKQIYKILRYSAIYLILTGIQIATHSLYTSLELQSAI